MSGTGVFVGGLLAVLIGGVAVVAGDAHAAGGDPALREDLLRLAGRRIYFGHQSVGWNLIDGLKRLAAQEGVALTFLEVKGPLSVPPGTFAHGPVEENGAPLRKLESFAATVTSGPPSPADVAFVKLCYVDFRADTDARQLFERYRATIDGLRARNPGTTFVHVTTPLTTVQEGPKAVAKRLLGRAPGGVKENARREEFNALLRTTYGGREPIFDLAALESTLADGTRLTVDWEGRAVPVLAGGYTDDGGHLNEAGRLRAARELARVLAQAPIAGAGEGR